MSHGDSATVKAVKAIDCGEYYTLAKKLNNLFITLTTAPRLLFNYLDREDRTLFEVACELFHQSPPREYLLPWAEILQSNEVPFDRVYLLFYAIICKIELPALSLRDHMILAGLQKRVAQENLIPSEYGSMEIQEGFQKLATFFVFEYHKNFSKKGISI